MALARAIYKNSDVIVLDEATNAFDSNSEKIFEKLKYLSENKIIIIITHNSEILKYCNKKFKIENGRLRKNFEKSYFDRWVWIHWISYD